LHFGHNVVPLRRNFRFGKDKFFSLFHFDIYYFSLKRFPVVVVICFKYFVMHCVFYSIRKVC
jgi:hypothetical protein